MNAEEFVKLLESTPDRLKQESYDVPLHEAAKSFGQSVSGNFQRQVDQDGNAWPEHSPATIALYGPHPLLRLTWTMYAAATNYENDGGKHQVEHRLIRFGIDGNEIPYAQSQQEGRGKIPQREFFYLSAEGEKDMREVVERACFKIIDGEIL